MRVRVNRYAVWVLLIIFCIFQYGIRKIYGFSMYPDEFGYWASAARTAGYDWSDVASLGSYYSFGYSLILFPILKVFGGGIAAYRAAIAVNVLLMCGSLFLTAEILNKLFPDIRPEFRFLLGGAAILYPAWIYYMQMTMTEAVLFFAFILDIYLFQRYMETKKIRTAVALAVSLIYGYCVHMRTVGVAAACVLAVLCWCAFGKGKKRGVVIGCAVLLASGMAALWLKDRTTAEIFTNASAEQLAVNDYGGQIAKLAKIFTPSGILQLIKEMAGKLYYLGIASFGTFYWGLGWCLKECVSLVREIRNRQEAAPAQWTALFLLLAAAGQITVSSIFKYDSSLADGLVYGRYNELLVPVMMAIGLAAMLKSRFLIRGTVLTGAALGAGTWFLLGEIERRNLGHIRGFHVPCLSYLLEDGSVDFEPFFRNTWFLGLGMMFLVCACVWLGRWRNSTGWLLSGILVMEAAAGMQISTHYTYTLNEVVYDNLRIADQLKASAAEGAEIWYLDEGSAPFVDFLQMQIPEQSIRVISTEELERIDPPGSVVVTSAETKQKDRLEQFFNKNITANLFCLYYNESN